jgi:putative membrane protein
VPRLLILYQLQALLALPAFPFLAVYFYFRYHTLRYRFDDEGISMAWGILFRREIHLTYARIQDIHLVSHVLERFLGLARIQIQTASGKAGAEMVLEGLPDHEGVRDFLYARMRGAASHPPTHPDEAGDGTTAAIQELTSALRDLQKTLEARP